MVATKINSKKPHEIREVLLEGDEYELSGPIDEIITTLQNMKAKAELCNGYEIYVSIEKDVEWEYGESYPKVEIEVSCHRLETDKEIKSRLTRWKKSKLDKKKAKNLKENEDLELYKSLKERFEDEK